MEAQHYFEARWLAPFNAMTRSLLATDLSFLRRRENRPTVVTNTVQTSSSIEQCEAPKRGRSDSLNRTEDETSPGKRRKTVPSPIGTSHAANHLRVASKSPLSVRIGGKTPLQIPTTKEDRYQAFLKTLVTLVRGQRTLGRIESELEETRNLAEECRRAVSQYRAYADNMAELDPQKFEESVIRARNTVEHYEVALALYCKDEAEAEASLEAQKVANESTEERLIELADLQEDNLPDLTKLVLPDAVSEQIGRCKQNLSQMQSHRSRLIYIRGRIRIATKQLNQMSGRVTAEQRARHPDRSKLAFHRVEAAIQRGILAQLPEMETEPRGSLQCCEHQRAQLRQQLCKIAEPPLIASGVLEAVLEAPDEPPTWKVDARPQQQRHSSDAAGQGRSPKAPSIERSFTPIEGQQRELLRDVPSGVNRTEPRQPSPWTYENPGEDDLVNDRAAALRALQEAWQVHDRFRQKYHRTLQDFLNTHGQRDVYDKSYLKNWMYLVHKIGEAEEAYEAAQKRARDGGARACTLQESDFASRNSDGYNGSLYDGMVQHVDRERIEAWRNEAEPPTRMGPGFTGPELPERRPEDEDAVETWDSISCTPHSAKEKARIGRWEADCRELKEAPVEVEAWGGSQRAKRGGSRDRAYWSSLVRHATRGDQT